MATTDERRRSQRFPLKLPLNLKWHEEGGEKLEETTVRDISSSGVYFYLPQPLKSGGKIEFYVQLQGESFSASGVCLHCLGTILRVDPDTSDDENQPKVGVAVKIDRYRFLRPGEFTLNPKRPAAGSS